MGCCRTDLLCMEGSFSYRYDVSRGVSFLGRGRGRGDTKSLGRGM